MEIECDLASIRDEDLLRKMWQQSEDFGRKKEIRSHLYKLRESRLREFYSTGGPGGEIMNPATDLHFGKTPLTPSHGDSLVDQSFQSLKSKEIRDSLSPTHDIKFRNSGGVAGGVLVPDTTGWDVQTSSEVSPDGRAFRTESLAKTDGVEKIPGGHAEFAGRNEQKSSASHQGDDKNYVKKAAESSKTHLQEKVVIGDENSGRTEMKSSSVTSSSKVVSSSSQQVFSSDDPGFDMEPRRITNQDQRYQNVLQGSNNSTSSVHSERQQFSRNEHNERQETSSKTLEESKKYVDMDKASPEYQQHVQYLMSQPGAIVSNTVEYPKPGVKMITTVKKLPDGTTVKTKRYETEASAAGADNTSISQTMKQQQKISSNTTTSQKMTEKRIQDSEDVFTRLSRTRDANVPAGPRNAPETPSQEDVYSRLQHARDTNDQKFSDIIDQRSTQILRDSNQHPGSRNAPTRRPSDLVENVEMISKTNKTVKKDLNQSVRSEKITSSDFIQNERDRYVLDHESPSRRGPDGYPEALVPITPSRHGRPQTDDYPTNGYGTTEVIKQSSLSKSSAKFSESRRFSTETVESYQHSENENQDYTTRGYPSNRRPIDEPKGHSPSAGRPGPDFSTHGFPSVRSDKPTQQHPSDKPRAPEEYNITERVHIIQTDRPRPGDVNHSDTTTTRSNYSTNETRRHVTSTNEDFSTHGFPSVRAGTPTRDSPRRPLGADPSPGESPRRPSGQEPPVHQTRRPPSDGYSTHGFPSVKSGSPTEDSPRRPSGAEPTNQGRRPTTEEFSTHGFPSVKPGRSTPTQSAPHYESSPRVDREDTVSVTSDRSNSVIYEKKIDAAHQAFARSLRCASPVESIRRDSTSDRHTPRSSIGSIRNSYSPSKRDGRSPSHDSVTNSESSRISSATVTKTNRPTEVRRLSSPKSPIGKSAPSHVSNETIDLSLTRKITARPSPDKTANRPTTIKEEQPVIVEPILRKKIIGATQDFLASEGVIEKPIIKNQQYYQLGLSDATLPSSHSKARQSLGLGTTPNTSRRPHHNTEEEVNTLIDTTTKHITTHPTSPVTPTTRSAKNKEPKPIQPETIHSKKPPTKPEGYITLSEANEITKKHNQTTDKHVSYPHYIPSAPKADRSPSDRPTTNNLPSPAPTSTTTTSTTPHNAPKSTKDNKVKSPSTSTTKPLSSPSKVDNNTTSRFTKTVKVENAINRDTTTTKTRRQPDLEPESELDNEPLAEPEDLDEGYVPDRKGKRKPSSQRPTSDDEGFEPDSSRAGSPTSDFEYRRPEQVRETYDEEDSIVKKTKRTDKKVVTNDFLNTERNVTETRKTQETPSYLIDVEKPDGRKPIKPSYSADKPTKPHEDQEPKRPSRRPKEEDTDQIPSSKDRKPSKIVDEPRNNRGPDNEPRQLDEDNRRPSYGKEPERPEDKTSRPRGTKPPLERSETFEERCRQILGMDSETVVDRTKKTQEFIETERTTVDSKRQPTDRSPSPKKRQPSDTVSIEDCDDDEDISYPGKTTTTKTTVKTTRDYPRDRSPNKKEPTSNPKENDTSDRPRDRSPVGMRPKGPKTNEYDETTTIVTTTKITDDRATSPNRKSPKEGKPTDEDDVRPRGRSPTERPGRLDETTTIRRTAKIVDEIDERSTRSKPGSRPRDQSPQETRPGDKSPSFGRSPSPQKKQPSDTVSIEDCDDDSDTPNKNTTSKTTRTTVKTTREHPRDKSPLSEKRPNRKSPKDNEPIEPDNDFHPRGRSPSQRPGRVNETTSVHKTTEIVNEIDKKSTRSRPGSRPRDQSPREKSPINDRLPRDRSPSENRTFITTRETTFDVDTTTRGKSPSKQPVRERSPTDEAPRDKSPSKKPARGTSPTGEYPRDRSPTTKPVRETSPSAEAPRGKSPLKKPIRGTTPTDEYPRDRSPAKKPTIPTTTDETIITSTTTTHSNVTDGIIEDRYPSYTPKSYPRDRSPLDKQKPKPHQTTEEDVTVEISKKTKKTLTEDIHDDVFEVKRPRDRQPDTRDGSYISHPRDQSPTEPLSRLRTNDSPRERSPEKVTTKDTDESVTKRTTKKTTDTTIQSQFTDKSPVSRPRDSPRERSPSKKPTTDDDKETTTIRRDTTHGPHPNDYPRDRSPVEDLTRPKTKGISETHRVDKKTYINEFLDTERGVVDRPHRPRDSKPIDNRSPDRLTSSHPRDFPVNKEYPTSKPKGPTSSSIDDSTTIKTTKTTTIENEEIFPSTRPRDRSPTEKPLRSPKIITTETTTEYGIRSRPRSRSPSEEPEKPSTDSEEIDETYVQKISKKTEKRTITTDLDVDVEKPNRQQRPTGTEDRPKEKSPQKTKPSDRSPSPRSKYPKDQGPRPVDNRPQSRSPVGKQPKTIGSPRQNSPSEKSRIYHSTDEESNVVKKSKTTKVTTTSEDLEEVGFENRPRGRSPSEKPRPTVAYQSPKDHPRRSSPTKKPEDREPIDRDYEELLVTRTNKSTRNETTLEEKTDRSPRNYPEDKPREKSPLSKHRGPRPTEETEDRLPKSPRGTSPSKNYPRERSPSDKPGSRDYPRDRSPSDKPRKPGMIERTTTESTTIVEHSSKSPRGTSPIRKPSPRDYPRDKSPTDKSRKPRLYDETVVVETTSESTTTKDRLSKSPRHTSPSEKTGPRNYPRDRSPTDKPNKSRPIDETSPTRKPVGRQPRPVGETVVQRTVKTTTVDDRTTKTSRGSSPSKTSPRERSPTQKQPTKDSPRRTSPSEKPTRRQPIVSEVEKTVQKTTSKFSKDKTTSEKITVQDHPRRKSPSEKPKRRPTSDEETDDDDETTETVIAVYTIDGETVKNHPRDLSPSGRPKQPSEYSPKRPQTNGDVHYPIEKPTRRQPTDEETEETFISTTTKLTKGSKTFDIEEDDQSPRRTYPGDKPKTTRDQPRETSPSGKPRTRQPTDESIDITVVKKTSRTQKGETTLEETEYQFPEDRPRDGSPSGKPSVRSYPRDSSPKKPTQEDIVTKSRRIPFDDDKPRGPDSTEETIVYTTRITSQIEDHPRDRSPSNKPGTRSYPRDRSPTDKPATKTYPADKSPTDKPSRPRPSKLEETTNKSTTVRKTIQETDFEKRYPKGRPGDQSPSEKPSTLRRPSKLSTTTTTTTTTRNRSTLDEQDINRTQRPRTQPSTREKIPTKTTPLSSPRSQPTTERRVPAELPSPIRKPKSTFGVTTKTTTTVTSRLTGATRPKPTTESPRKPSKLPVESRPSARPTERKHSPSISPDSSPSRPGSDVEIDSPYRSPNMSPSRKSPSPTRSVKLEDITETVSSMRKTTVSIDKTKPKVTHVTTAKFQVTPPTSPTKVTSSPEKFSPSSRKPSSKVPTSKPIGSKFTTDTTTTKKVTSKVYKDVPIPTDSERDSEVPTDAEEVDTPLSQKPSTRKMPVTERKESAPVHRVTKVNKDVQMSRSTSENIIKTPINKRPIRHEPLETQRESPRPTLGDRSSPKTERRPSKHLSTKTINLTTFDKVINSEDMENVVIDIQHAKSSREPSPNKIVPTPVSIDVYTGKPRYPDVVQEPEDEPKRKPSVKNIPIFEEETNDFIGCQITEVSEETNENTVKSRTTKFIEKESSPRRQTPKIVTGDNVDSECLLSVHDKVSKFISTAEEVSKPKTSAPFRRDIPEKDVPEDDECLLTVDEKVSKFLKTADSVTKEVVTSKPRRVERPSIEDLDEDLKTDECVLSVSEKVNKFTTKAEKLAPSAPQRSPELVARIERQISRPSDVESESPEGEDSPVSVRKFKPTSPLTERTEKKYTERQIDILSRPSVWEKKPKPDVKLNDIIGLTPEDEPRRETLPKIYPQDGKSKPIRPTDSVSKRKELFENKVSTNKTTTTTIKQNSPEKRPSGPAKSPADRHPSDDSDSRYPNEFIPQFVDGYAHQEADDAVHEDVYGSSRTRNIYEVSHDETVQRSSERSPTRKSSHPENRPTTQTTTKSPRQPEDNTPSRRYSEDHSPRYPTRDQPSTDRYTETRESSDHTTRRRSSTQEYPERRTPFKGSPSPRRNQQPVEEPEDYTFSSRRDETTTHHTTRTAPRSPKDSPLNEPSFLDDDEQDHSPARSTSTVSSHKQVTTHRSTTKRVTEDISSRRPRRPSGNEPSTPTSGGRTPRGKAVPETVAARRNIFEKSPGDISPMPTNRRPSYMEPTKSSLEHRKDSLEITKTNYSRKSSIEEEPYEPSPKTSVKFGVGLKHKEEPKPKRKLSSSDIPNIEDVFELELLEEMLNIVTLYEQRRRIRAQIRVVKKLLETKTKEEVSRMTKISTIRKTSSSSVRESPTPTPTQKRETPVRSEKYHQLTDDEIDSESIIESRHVEEHEEIIRERSVSPKTKTSRIVTKVTEVRKIGEPTTTTTTTTTKRTPLKKDEPKDSKPIWATKNILKKPSDNEKVTRALSAKKTTSTSSSMSRTQQTHRQRVATDDDCVTSSYGIGPTDEDGRPLFGIRALKKKTTTTNNTVQPSETTKVTGTVITEKYYSENGAEPVGERKVTVYSTNPEDLTDMETQYDRRDSETVKREKLSKDGVTTVTKVQKIGKYKPGEIPSLTDDAEFTKATSKMVRRGSVKEMSEKFIRKESSSSVTEKSSGYPKAGLILRTRTNSGATADAADQYEVRAKSTEYDYDSEDDVEIRSSRKHSKVVTESEDETEIRRKINTRSFLNSGGSKVTGVDDVLVRMRNADNVVVDGDTMEDREARSLLNKFLGASVLMSGMESMIPQMELRKTTGGADNKQEVKTTRVTKTIKSGTTGGSSSSPVARETCDFEEIWDEEILKQLLEKSTSYEERRSIRARLRQLMAEREACAESKAGAKAELNETKVKTSTVVAEDESSGSEYEEIIEEYTASEDDDEDEETTTTTTTVIAEKEQKDESKEEKSTKQITEGIQNTTVTKKEEPKSVQSKKTVVVETTTVVIEEDDDSSASCSEEKKLSAKPKEEDTSNVNVNVNNDNDGDSDSVSDSKGESLLIPLLQGLLHKNMPQARSSSGSSSKTATNSATTSNQNSNNLKSSLKANNTHFSSTSKSNNNNSLGDSGLSSEVSKNSSLGHQKQNGSSLRVAAPQQIEDSGTESGEDLRLIAAGIRDSMQIEGIENHSDMSLIKEVTNALNKLESSLKEGKDLALDSSKKSTLLALVERLQTGLTAPDKLATAVGEQDFPDETSSPEADNHRSNRQRFAKRKNRNNRHTVGVSKEELADARRYMEEMVMIENLSNCTTPECNASTTPPELFAIQKQHSTGAILTSHEPQETSAGLFRPNQFVPNNLKHSTEAGSGHPEVQMRQKKGTPAPGQRQSTGDMNTIKVPNSDPNNGKRPLSDSFDAYTAQNNRVTFNESQPQNDNSVEEKNQYNRSHHSDDKQNNLGRLSPESSRLNRFNNKKQLMKRANTIDIPKTHRYNPEFDTDSDFEERSALNTKGLRGTLQVTVKRKPRQVVPNFEPKTENDHKFLAFIQKQNTTTGVGWNSSKSVSNWTNKFGNIKNVFESGANAASSNKPKTSGPPSSSSAKSFWKKSEEQNPPKTSTSVLTSALKAKERNEKRSEVIVPKPIHLNQFSHNPQSAFRPVDTSPETIQMQFKPIPTEKPSNAAVNSLSPTKAYNPVRRQALESPHYAQSSPTKSWIKKNTATNSPVSLPWTAKPPENNVLKIAATKFESNSPVQRHQSFKQQEKRPSLPNTQYPYQYQDYGHSQSSYVSNSQPASYAEYPPQPRIYRESSLTNPQAEPLVLTSSAPAYSPHSLQPFDYYADDLNQNAHQTDMTDDDIDDMESMTEYRVEAKVMGKPLSQQAVTVGKRTNHMSDDEVFGKNSKAAKNLLSVMKNIGNGKPDRISKKLEKKQPPASCISPNGSAYQAPIVEPLFPEVTKFETKRDPEYIGKPQSKQQGSGYQKNPVYVPLEEYQHNDPPVAPPRGRKLSQEAKKGSAYVPKERPNVYQPPRRDAPSSLPIQAGPTSPPRYMYSSPIKSPESSSTTSQILSDGMYMQNVPAFRKPYSEPNTPSDYSGSNEAYFNQYGQMQKSYPAPQPPVILPQIPLETSYTKVYDQPRDVSSFYQPPLENPNSGAYIHSSAKVQQSTQPSMYIPPEYQQKPEIPQQYYQPLKVHQSPQPQEYVAQQAYQPRSEISPEYYSSPKAQQGSQPFVPQQGQAFQPRAEAPQEYYQPLRTQNIPPPQGLNQDGGHLPKAPVAYYQAPKTQPSPQPQTFAPQYADTPAKYDQSPRVPQSPRSDISQSYYQSPKTQQSSSSEIPLQYAQSPRTPQAQSSVPQQGFKYPQPHQTQTYQPSKTQQSPQPMSPLYQPRAPMVQAKPQVPPKNESVIQSSKSQHSSSTYQQQHIQSVVVPKRPVEQQAPNAAVLCKQASLEGRNRVQSQSQKYEQVEEIRRKSLGNVLEVTRVEQEAREQKAAAIKQDMYSVQQDIYSQQKSIKQRTEVHQQETKVMYKSSAPDDTPDIVKSSLKKDDIPILKKFGPPQRHCYMPNAYQNPLMKSETTAAVVNKAPKTVSRKFSDPAVSRGPLIVEIPSTPQPDSQDEIPRNIVLNNISAFTSMSRRQAETSTEYTSQQNRPNKLSKCDSWHQICQLQNVPKPPSPRFNQHGNAAIRRSKSGHTLALPKLYEASYDRAEISEKQRTVAAYFTGQKSPNSLSRNSSQTNLAEECNYVTVKKSSINRIKTSEKASISRQDPSSGLSRSHTMPQIANVNLLDESNVEDAFEQLMNGQSTTTTEKTETKKEDAGVVTTTTKVTTRTISGAPKPVSPFAKFQQLDKQNSLQSPKSPLTPTTPGGSSTTPIFRFTDPALNARAATFKEQLLQWCQSKTQEYENVQITNFSASWTDGLAFCALIHHFLPDAFDYSKLNPKQRRYNFELAFRVADEKAGIAPLLDVEDMVVMKRPDWKCVFTYVQSIYRRFRNCQ